MHTCTGCSQYRALTLLKRAPAQYGWRSVRAAWEKVKEMKCLVSATIAWESEVKKMWMGPCSLSERLFALLTFHCSWFTRPYPLLLTTTKKRVVPVRAARCHSKMNVFFPSSWFSDGPPSYSLRSVRVRLAENSLKSLPAPDPSRLPSLLIMQVLLLQCRDC